MPGERILVVDDEPGVREALAGILDDEGFEVTTCESGEQALEAVADTAFDAALLDIWLPGKDGLEVLLALRERQLDLEVVMISGHGTIETAVRATKLGAFDFVEKPLSLEKTLLVLRNALRQRRLERRNRQLLDQLHRDSEILGRSAAAEKVRREVAAATASDAPVLLCGERGSGRETAARRVHASGSRSGQAFVDVPCATLDDAATALFGEGREGGRLRLAGRGTLFLNEAEQLPRNVQRRMASYLDRTERAPDVRVLASTTEVAELDPALRQRLDVLRIVLPPLRERREDVPLLVERFMSDLSKEYGKAPKRFEPAALAALRAHDWPGNVRELRNLTERLLLLVPGDVVRAEDLPEELSGSGGPAEDLYREFESLAEGLETFGRYYVRRILTEERGDHGRAAGRLGLSPEALRRRLKKLKLP